jgi:hypothetical protein
MTTTSRHPHTPEGKQWHARNGAARRSNVYLDHYGEDPQEADRSNWAGDTASRLK